MATVVSKLLLQVMPDVALFGEKDYQQLCVIKRLVRDLNLDTSIVGVPTVRDIDGLALSSRNQYLSEEERAIAPKLYETLRSTANVLHHAPDADVAAMLDKAKATLTNAGFGKIDYLEMRAEDTLKPLERYSGPARLLVAAHLGKTRLIDNVPVAPRTVD